MTRGRTNLGTTDCLVLVHACDNWPATTRLLLVISPSPTLRVVPQNDPPYLLQTVLSAAGPPALYSAARALRTFSRFAWNSQTPMRLASGRASSITGWTGSLSGRPTSSNFGISPRPPTLQGWLTTATSWRRSRQAAGRSAGTPRGRLR